MKYGTLAKLAVESKESRAWGVRAALGVEHMVDLVTDQSLSYNLTKAQNTKVWLTTI